MANGLQLNASTAVAGIGTQSFTITTAGPYTLAVNFTIPYKASGDQGDSSVTTGTSSLSIALKQGNTTLLTISSPSTNQPSMSGQVRMLCAAADVITVVTTSSAAADAGLNAIKGIVNLYQGV